MLSRRSASNSNCPSVRRAGEPSANDDFFVTTPSKHARRYVYTSAFDRMRFFTSFTAPSPLTRTALVESTTRGAIQPSTGRSSGRECAWAHLYIPHTLARDVRIGFSNQSKPKQTEQTKRRNNDYCDGGDADGDDPIATGALARDAPSRRGWWRRGCLRVVGLGQKCGPDAE